MADTDTLVPRLKAERERRGWSQRRLAGELQKVAARDDETLPETDALISMISRWENGHRKPDVFYRYLLRKVYGHAGAETSGQAGTVASSGPAPGDEELSTRLAMARPRLVRLDAGLLTDLAGLTDIYRRMDRRLGAPAVLSELTQHYARVVALREHPASATDRQRLAAIAADIGALLGWQAIDLGRGELALAHFRGASQAADEAADATLLAFVVAERGYLPLLQGRPRDALEVFEHAREVGGRRTSPVFDAWLAGAVGEAHAVAGDEAGSLRALERGERLLETAGTGEGHAPPLAHFDSSHLIRWRGQCLAHLGRAGEAEAELSAALSQVDPSFVRARAGLLLDLATARLNAHALDEACEAAGKAYQLACETQSRRYRERFAAFRARLEPWASSAPVRALDELSGAAADPQLDGGGGNASTCSRPTREGPSESCPLSMSPPMSRSGIHSTRSDSVASAGGPR